MAISPLLTLFLTTLILLPILLKLIQRKSAKQLLPLPPGPRGLPILGSLLFLSPNLHHYFSSLSQSYGPVLSLRLGSKLCVVISSPSAAREIFKTHDNVFANHAIPASAATYLRNASPNILFAPSGPLWRMLRKTAVREMLGPAGIENVAPFRSEEMRRAVEDVWGKARSGAAVDVRETAFRTMLNMMTSMLWGERVACVGEGREFRRAIEGVVDLLTVPNAADFFPAMAWVDPQGMGRRMRKLLAWINKYLDDIVERKKRMMTGGERRRDVLESLLDCVDQGDPPFTLDCFYKLVVVSLLHRGDNCNEFVAHSEPSPTKCQKRVLLHLAIFQQMYLLG